MLGPLSLLFLSFGAVATYGYDNSRSDNVSRAYWIYCWIRHRICQNSYGATHSSDTANWQKSLATYCEDDTINAIPLAFLDVFFSTGNLPEIDFANTCGTGSGVFPGTNLANCKFMAADIQACQAKGKIITLSIGGATGGIGLTGNKQAEAFAETVWNLFLGGTSDTRPFGDAVLDGVDLDIEGGASTGYAAFVTKIRSLATDGSKQFYVTGAPQCPFPDAYLGTVVNAVGFDALYVQFYNNFCGLTNFDDSNGWNFASWDEWAKKTSPNKDVKIFIGAPASTTAAGSGYVPATTLGKIALETRAQYSSFGGVMLWDASQAYANGRLDTAIKGAIAESGSRTGAPIRNVTTTPTATSTASTSAATASGSCAKVAEWENGVAYGGGVNKTYNGHLWTALFWSNSDTPGGSAGLWSDNGACADAISAPVKRADSLASIVFVQSAARRTLGTMSSASMLCTRGANSSQGTSAF
ncbi:glycoside hydrolase [Mycena vitilis]|nr:glycoside hydrolase [Mycena vitilis]